VAETQDDPQAGFAPDSARVECDVIRVGDQAVVTVRGDLDFSTASAVQREIFAVLEPPIQAIEIDLGGVSFMDSSGLGLLNQIRVATRSRTSSSPLLR
jgi:anti-anti-sigma factor